MAHQFNHGDPAYNIYQELCGSYLVCRCCQVVEVRASHQHSYQLGWVHDLCPSCVKQAEKDEASGVPEEKKQAAPDMRWPAPDLDDIPF
jgi:hypothetical protein